MRIQYLTLTAALAGSALASSADAALTFHLQGRFETLQTGAGFGPAPLPIDLTYNIFESSLAYGSVYFYGLTLPGSIGSQTFGPYISSNVGSLDRTFLQILSNGMLDNGNSYVLGIRFDGANPALSADFITSASLSYSHLSIMIYSPTYTSLGEYTDFRVTSVTSFGSVQGAGGVPEPSSWALMLTGFGAVGYAMRRRQKVRHAVSFA